MWADIRDQTDRLGPVADAYREWVWKVDNSVGDPPAKATDLVARLAGPEAGNISGQFLWIENGLQRPIPSWEPTDSTATD